MSKLYHFAKAVSKDFKWIAKDDDETVVLATNKPVKVAGSWEDGYGTSCVEIRTELMGGAFSDDMFSELGTEEPINLDNIRDERYADFTNEDLRDIHRALKSKEQDCREYGKEETATRYSELAGHVIGIVHYDEGKHHIGERGVSADGIGMEIIMWGSKVNITVKFDNGRVLHRQNYKKFRNGKLYAVPPKEET